MSCRRMFVAAQIDAVFADLDVRAVKIGMVAQRATIEAIVDALERWSQAQIVLDPVMVATSGDRLLEAEAVAALRARLIPQAAILTPNLPEAAALLDEPVAAGQAAIEAQGRRLLALGCRRGADQGRPRRRAARAWIIWSARPARSRCRRRAVPTRNTHGTGCSLSSAIAAGLARGETLETAVRQCQGLDQRRDRRRRPFQRRPRPRADPPFSPILLVLRRPARRGTNPVQGFGELCDLRGIATAPTGPSRKGHQPISVHAGIRRRCISFELGHFGRHMRPRHHLLRKRKTQHGLEHGTEDIGVMHGGGKEARRRPGSGAAAVSRPSARSFRQPARGRRRPGVDRTV